jgi:hypothetical protein
VVSESVRHPQASQVEHPAWEESTAVTYGALVLRLTQDINAGLVKTQGASEFSHQAQATPARKQAAGGPAGRLTGSSRYSNSLPAQSTVISRRRGRKCHGLSIGIQVWAVNFVCGSVQNERKCVNRSWGAAIIDPGGSPELLAAGAAARPLLFRARAGTLGYAILIAGRHRD